MKRSAKPIILNEEEALKLRQEAKNVSKSAKIADDRGKGYSTLDKGDVFLVPELSNLDYVIGAKKWEIGSRSGLYPTIRLLTNINREVEVSQNGFAKPLKLPEFEGEAKVHRKRWSSVLASQFKCPYDMWAFLAWMCDNWKEAAENGFIVDSHSDITYVYGGTQKEVTESRSFCPNFTCSQTQIENMIKQFFAEYPTVEHGVYPLPWASVYETSN